MSDNYVDGLYFSVSLFALMLACYFLYSTKKYIYKKVIVNKISDAVTVQTNNGVIRMDPNVFENHIKRVKSNLLELNRQFSPEICEGILEHLQKNKNETAEFIKQNQLDGDFCDIDARYKLVDDSIIKKQTELTAQIDRYSTDSLESLEVLKAKQAVVELLIDLDVILFLVRTTMCPKGKLNLKSLDKMLLALYQANCVDKEVNNKLNDVEDNYIAPLVQFNEVEKFADNDANLKHVMSRKKNILRNSPPRVGYDLEYEERDNIRLNSGFKPNVAKNARLSNSSQVYGLSSDNKLRKVKAVRSIIADSDRSLFVDPRQHYNVDKGARSSLIQDAR